MSVYFLLFICICLTGCMGINSVEDGYTKYSNKITEQYLNQICQNEKFCPVGRGGTNSNGKQAVFLILETIGYHDIASARQLCVEMEEEFLKLLNNSREIRPYLLRYPSGIDAFKITIGFKQPQGSFVQPPYLGQVTVFEDEIYYYVDNHERKIFTRIYSEPYEEGYKIVYGKEKEIETNDNNDKCP